jgi:hypothetical protein
MKLPVLFSRRTTDAAHPAAGSVTGSGLDVVLCAVPAANSSLPEVPPSPAPELPARARSQRLLFAVDATASRESAWNTAKRLTDTLFTAVPDRCPISLAVHGGSRVHTFTPFTTNAASLRSKAASVQCEAGGTTLLPILRRALALTDIGTIVYVGDHFEESKREAFGLAQLLAGQRTRLIVLHDGRNNATRAFFRLLAEATEGTVLPFDANAVDGLRDLLHAVVVMTVHGLDHLRSHEAHIKGATLLLQHLRTDPDVRRIAASKGRTSR